MEVRRKVVMVEVLEKKGEKIEVYKLCPMCDEQHYIELSNEQARKLFEYEHGKGYIQEIFPEFNKAEREFLKTGYCPKCQEMIFGNGETDKIKSAKESDR